MNQLLQRGNADVKLNLPFHVFMLSSNFNREPTIVKKLFWASAFWIELKWSPKVAFSCLGAIKDSVQQRELKADQKWQDVSVLLLALDFRKPSIELLAPLVGRDPVELLGNEEPAPGRPVRLLEGPGFARSGLWTPDLPFAHCHWHNPLEKSQLKVFIESSGDLCPF